MLNVDKLLFICKIFIFFLKGPFSNFKISKDIRDQAIEWTGLKFSPDGKTILVSTNGSMIKLIDAFDGHVIHTFTVCYQEIIFFLIIWNSNENY